MIVRPGIVRPLPVGARRHHGRRSPLVEATNLRPKAKSHKVTFSKVYKESPGRVSEHRPKCGRNLTETGQTYLSL